MKIILSIALFLCGNIIYGQKVSSIEYFRHLQYNHVSPYIGIKGIHPITQSEAKSTSHYIFKYDEKERIIEILNNHYHTEKRHPLASLGVYKLSFEYRNQEEIRTFYDPNGKRISNDRNVYKEVYSYDEDQFKNQLQFYDLDDHPMESNWAINKYNWSKNNDLIIERRYNLNNELANLSPYFEFGITGISIRKNGSPRAQYNLDANLKIVDNSTGIASYRDSFDLSGNHVTYSYFNAQNKLTLNKWQFATGQKSYDDLGNNILLEQFDTEGKPIRSRNVYSNVTVQNGSSGSSLDSIAIKKQSLGYLKALQKLDPILMDGVMNDSLNKVTIGYNRDLKKQIAKATTRDQMISFAESWNKSNTKFPPFPSDKVTILGIYDRIASVKLVSDNWVEFLHLIKLNDEWKIINLIWQHKDVSRYSN